MADEGNKKKVNSKEPEEKELDEILTEVVRYRKTVPKQCMKLDREIMQYEIKQIENAEVKLKETKEKKRLLNLVHKLGNCRRAKLCLDDMREAEENVRRYFKKLKEINIYLKKRKNYIK